MADGADVLIGPEDVFAALVHAAQDGAPIVIAGTRYVPSLDTEDGDLAITAAALRLVLVLARAGYSGDEQAVADALDFGMRSDGTMRAAYSLLVTMAETIAGVAVWSKKNGRG